MKIFIEREMWVFLSRVSSLRGWILLFQLDTFRLFLARANLARKQRNFWLTSNGASTYYVETETCFSSTPCTPFRIRQHFAWPSRLTPFNQPTLAYIANERSPNFLFTLFVRNSLRSFYISTTLSAQDARRRKRSRGIREKHRSYLSKCLFHLFLLRRLHVRSTTSNISNGFLLTDSRQG